MRRHVFVGGMVAVMAVAVLAVPAVAADNVFRKNNPNEPDRNVIQILDLTRENIEFLRQGGSVGRVPHTDVARYVIDYAGHDRPADFRRAKEAMDQARWAQAIELFARLLNTVQAGNEPLKIVRHLSLVHLCECGAQLAGGQVGNSTGWNTVLEYAPILEREFAQSYFRGSVLELAGMAHQAKGDGDAARRVFETLARVDPARGRFRLALVLFQRREYAPARNEFSEAMKAAGADSNTKERCELYVAWCSLRLGQWDAAMDVFQRLVSENGSNQPNVVGSAYLGLGLCQSRAGSHKEAFYSFGKTATVFKAAVTGEELADAIGYCAISAREIARRDPSWEPHAKVIQDEYSRRYPRRPLPELPK